MCVEIAKYRNIGSKRWPYLAHFIGAHDVDDAGKLSKRLQEMNQPCGDNLAIPAAHRLQSCYQDTGSGKGFDGYEAKHISFIYCGGICMYTCNRDARAR